MFACQSPLPRPSPLGRSIIRLYNFVLCSKSAKKMRLRCFCQQLSSPITSPMLNGSRHLDKWTQIYSYTMFLALFSMDSALQA